MNNMNHVLGNLVHINNVHKSMTNIYNHNHNGQNMYYCIDYPSHKLWSGLCVGCVVVGINGLFVGERDGVPKVNKSEYSSN